MTGCEPEPAPAPLRRLLGLAPASHTTAVGHQAVWHEATSGCNRRTGCKEAVRGAGGAASGAGPHGRAGRRQACRGAAHCREGCEVARWRAHAVRGPNVHTRARRAAVHRWRERRRQVDAAAHPGWCGPPPLHSSAGTHGARHLTGGLCTPSRAGHDEPDAGSVVRRRNTTVGFLAQARARLPLTLPGRPADRVSHFAALR